MPNPQVIGGGTVSVTASFIQPVQMTINADGSCIINVSVLMNGAVRMRQITISADGSTYTLDGAALTPWAALSALGAAQPGAKVNAVLSAPGATTPLTSP
jgi:hypothetical protein